MIERRKRLEMQLDKTSKLLFDWEDKLAIAENPAEKERCKIEINHLKTIINGYKTELNDAKTDFNMKISNNSGHRQEFEAQNIKAKNIINALNVTISEGNSGVQHITTKVPENQTAKIKKKVTPKKAILLILNAVALFASLIWLNYHLGKNTVWEPFVSVILCLCCLIIQYYKIVKH